MYSSNKDHEEIWHPISKIRTTPSLLSTPLEHSLGSQQRVLSIELETRREAMNLVACLHCMAHFTTFLFSLGESFGSQSCWFNMNWWMMTYFLCASSWINSEQTLLIYGIGSINKICPLIWAKDSLSPMRNCIIEFWSRRLVSFWVKLQEHFSQEQVGKGQ